MKAIISRTSNGACVRFLDRNDPSSSEDLSFHFDSSTNEDGIDLSVLTQMLREVISRMGWDGRSRYDRERIQVSIVHGDKFEHDNAEDKGKCSICLDKEFV